MDLFFKKLTPTEAAQAYRAACIAELQALKPGNVHLFADGHGMTVHDFIKSADASAKVIALPDLELGERIYAAVKVTKDAVGLNTNLGVILLCAPLIQVILHGDTELTLQQNLSTIISASTTSDAVKVSEAIVLASPAGLGEAGKYDVRHLPDAASSEVTLLNIMIAAQHKDRIAWQYANLFSDVLEFGVPVYADAYAKWHNEAWAATALYLGFLAKYADTHIVRKYGVEIAQTVQNEAEVMAYKFSAAENPKLIQKSLMDWDASLKQRSLNPGTSADLTVASILAYVLTR